MDPKFSTTPTLLNVDDNKNSEYTQNMLDIKL